MTYVAQQGRGSTSRCYYFSSYRYDLETEGTSIMSKTVLVKKKPCVKPPPALDGRDLSFTRPYVHVPQRLPLVNYKSNIVKKNWYVSANLFFSLMRYLPKTNALRMLARVVLH